MPTETLNQPLSIPWKLIAASPDMLDTKYCDKRFPFAWRSSIAISAYEPNAKDLPDELCGDRLTYLKVTCSITGYQPSKEETERGYVSFPDVPTEELQRILDQYFACYGVLLNVAVFPKPEFETTSEEIGSIDFSRLKLTSLPNPCHVNDVVFNAIGQPASRTIDQCPPGGDGKPELDLFGKTVITFPTVSEARLTVAYYGAERIIVSAYRDDVEVLEQSAGADEAQPCTLSVSDEGGINRIMCVAPDGKASLLKIAFYRQVTRTLDAPIEKLPRIIDFEPKSRDLYQVATDSGEILTASRAGVQADKSHMHTESTETGVNLSAQVGGMIGPLSLTGNAGLSHQWGETDADTSHTEADASRERQEKHSTSTNLSQMYNLLTGYHPGTNRAVFLMLPRPHLLQPTDRRSFIQGVRVIEGVQDFFLIVTRPKTVNELCVETMLETAHFPESVEIEEPAQQYDRRQVDFDHGPFTAKEAGTFGSRNEESIEGSYSGFEDDVEGWHFDPTQGVPGRGGIAEAYKYNDDNADGPETGGGVYSKLPRMEDYFYNTQSPDKVLIAGKIRSGVSFDVVYHRKFRVFLRRPKQMTEGAQADVSELLITSRGLCACFKPVQGCFEVTKYTSPPQTISEGSDCIVDEIAFRMPAVLLSRDANSKSRSAAIKELLRRTQIALSTTWRLPSRLPYGEVGFLDSDYFKNQIAAIMSKEKGGRRLKDISGLDAGVIWALGEDCSVAEALKFDLSQLMRKTGLTVRQALAARRAILGVARPR